MGKTPEEIKDLTREYHEAIQDLRAEIKRVREFQSEENIRNRAETILEDILNSDELIRRLVIILRDSIEVETKPYSEVEDYSPVPIEGNSAAVNISNFANQLLQIITSLPEMNERQFILYIRDEKPTPSLDREANTQKVAVRICMDTKRSLQTAKAELLTALNASIKQWED